MYLNYFGQKDIIKYYGQSVTQIGLWNAEKRSFLKYVAKDTPILDIGTGAGRVAFGLYNLGYNNIVATDFCEDILNEAIEINKRLNANIRFVYDDITDSKLEDNQFNAIIFSFNGFIIIPDEERRIHALQTINRLLKREGILILSTDTRRIDKKYNWFWHNELDRWKDNQQDQRINHFGEVIYNTEKGDMYFRHYRPEELVELLNKNGFKVLEDFKVGQKYKETQEVIEFCGNSHMWIARKINF